MDDFDVNWNAVDTDFGEFLLKRMLKIQAKLREIYLIRDKKGIERMGERMGRMEQIGTDFFNFYLNFQSKIKKNLSQPAPSAPSVLPFALHFFCSVLR
jgi:hypothetical protein